MAICGPIKEPARQDCRTREEYEMLWQRYWRQCMNERNKGVPKPFGYDQKKIYRKVTKQ